jgi:hypothetical protein
MDFVTGRLLFHANHLELNVHYNRRFNQLIDTYLP